MRWFRRIAVAALLGGVVPWATPVLAQVPADSGTRELRQQLQTLQQQLDELNSSRDAATQQRLMQHNWQGMQDYIGWMHNRWGVGYPWMMATRRWGAR